MKKRQIEIVFPTSGLNRKAAYRQQAPYSSPELLNVRAIEPIASRQRGGSRPGLMLSHIDNLGAAIQMLAPMTLNLGDGFTNFSDTFSGLTMSSAWSLAPWPANPVLPLILTDVPAASVDSTVGEADAILTPLTIDATQPYAVEMLIVPWAGTFAGSYRLYFRMNDSTPDATQDGCALELLMTDNMGNYSGTLTVNVAGTPTVYALSSGTMVTSQPGWLSAVVSGDAITVFWNGVQILSQTISAAAGSTCGFGMTSTVTGGVCLVNVFRVQYYSTGSVSQLRSMLMASAGGNLFYEATYGNFTQLSTDLTLRSDVPLMAVQDGQQLYIADYGQVVANGTDGTVTAGALTAVSIADWTAIGILPLDMVVVISNPLGSAIAGTYPIASVASGAVTLTGTTGTGACEYRIERAPKVYDPLANTLSLLLATAGQTPTGCPIIERYLDRIVLAGAEIAPQAWYMARVSTPTDWDYSALDTARAVAGTASPAGIPGDPITASVAHSDDYLIFGCRNSTWKMVGDPANGGTLVNLSHAIGMVGPKSWCLSPDGSMLFLSMDGIYILDSAGDAYPSSVSRETLPREFANFNPDMTTVNMEYDIHGGGIHIFLTPIYSNQSSHWWLDTGLDTSKSYGILSTVSRRTFFPFTLIGDHEPTASCTLLATAIEDSAVILGGRDGYLRRFSDLADTDCGTTFDSHVIIGPLALNQDLMVGSILSMDSVLADESGDVNWSLSPALTFEDAIVSPSTSSGTWSAGINPTDHPACRGQAATLTLSGTGRKWAIEQLSAILKDGGKRRIP